MAQSTTIINAKQLYATVTTQDISGSLASVTLTVDMQNAQHFTADGDFAFALVGKRQWSGSFNIYYSETSNEAYDELVTAFEGGTNTAILIVVDGNDSGDESLAGNVYFTSMPYTFDATTADGIMMSVPFVGNGTLTRSTVA